MKKLVVFLAILLYGFTLYGQQTVDYILKARASAEAGNPDMAISILNDALAIKKESRLYNERGEVLILKGDYSAAISDFNDANRTAAYSGEYGLARVYALKSDASTSLYHLGQNLNSPFKKTEKEIMLNAAFTFIDNKPEWRQFWKKEWYDFTERSISEIEYYISSGKVDESKELLFELKSRFQNGKDVLYGEALINFSSGKYNESIKIISGLLSAEPDNEKYLRILAKAQEAASNPAGASASYSRLINMGVADAELLISRAGCFKKTGEVTRALDDVEKYLGYYPENKNALSFAGKIEVLSGDNLKGLEYFSKNLKLHPNDAQCYVDRANSYFSSKSWDWAIKDYSMSLDLKPDDSDVWLNKGIALLNTGRSEDACHDFRKAFSMGNKRASEYISKNCIK